MAMSKTVLKSMPNDLAIDLRHSPAAKRALMSMTSCALSLEFLLAIPFGATCRPLRILSCILSKCVPKNKCSGLTHIGLSQVCSTWAPGGMVVLLKSSYENRWDRVTTLFTLRSPYPFVERLPVHGQQPDSSFLNLDRNCRSANSGGYRQAREQCWPSPLLVPLGLMLNSLPQFLQIAFILKSSTLILNMIRGCAEALLRRCLSGGSYSAPIRARPIIPEMAR